MRGLGGKSVEFSDRFLIAAERPVLTQQRDVRVEFGQSLFDAGRIFACSSVAVVEPHAQRRTTSASHPELLGSRPCPLARADIPTLTLRRRNLTTRFIPTSLPRFTPWVPLYFDDGQVGRHRVGSSIAFRR